MEYIYDAPFADKFVCNGELEWHDFYYINPHGTDENACVYQLNRTGMEWQCPPLFQVERSGRTPCCEIFCILAGRGTLFYRGETYILHKDQYGYWHCAGCRLIRSVRRGIRQRIAGR